MDVTVKSVEFEVSKAMKILRVALKDYLAFFIFWFISIDNHSFNLLHPDFP